MIVESTQIDVNNTSGVSSEVVTQYDCKTIPLTITSEDMKNPNVAYSDVKMLVMTVREIELSDIFIDTFGKSYSTKQSQRIWNNPNVFSVIVRSDRG